VGSDLLADYGKMDFAQLCRQMRIADGHAQVAKLQDIKSFTWCVDFTPISNPWSTTP
jgi:hypothetical protein